jgi:hypothetical protein
LVKHPKRKRKRGFEAGSKAKFRQAADAIRKHLSKRKNRKKSSFSSLPPSPFMTRRMSLDSMSTSTTYLSTSTTCLTTSKAFVTTPTSRTVTGSQVRRAAHEKSLRYRNGDFGRKSGRPKPPTTSPTKRFSENRHSRSLSDIASLLSFQLKEGMLMRKGTHVLLLKYISISLNDYL